MSISSALNAAQSGLTASSRRADIVANNVANASTPGYVRRSVSLSEALVSGNTGGVKVTGISRSSNEYLVGERRSIGSDLAKADLLSSVWNDLSRRVGDTADGPGLFSAMSRFESSLSKAALSPESGVDARGFIDAANDLIQELKTLSGVAVDMRAEADREIAVGVETVNDALKQIQELNTKITGTDRNSNYAATLMDERQRIMDSISEYIPVKAVPREFGTIDVVTDQGVFLLAGTAREIEFTPSNVFTPSQTLAGGQLSGLTVGGVDITPGASSYGAISSGAMGGLFQLRDQDLPAFSDQLDAIASDLVTRLSDDSIDPTKTPGDPGLFIDPDPAAGAGLAARLQLNPAVDEAQGGEVWRLRDGLGAAAEGDPGNGTILKNMLNAITAINTINTSGLQGQFSVADLTAHFSSLTGQTRIGHESVLSSNQFQYQTVIEAEQSESGVDIDAQMQELLLVEQAYSANARVIEVASQMINTLMEL